MRRKPPTFVEIRFCGIVRPIGLLLGTFSYFRLSLKMFVAAEVSVAIMFKGTVIE